MPLEHSAIVLTCLKRYLFLKTNFRYILHLYTIAEYGEAFMRFDEDRDGSVTYAELIELMKYLKIDTKKSAALSILDDIDLNGKHL